MRQLSGTDMLMLVTDRPYAQNLIAAVNVYDPSTAIGGRVSFDDILALVGSRLHVSVSFRERLVPVPFGLDRPWWTRDAGFDLEYHIRHTALPAPGDWRQFCTLVARLGARPLDMTRPPWELWVIEGLDNLPDVPLGSFATMLKLHHAAVDGVSGAEIQTALHDRSPNPVPAQQVPEAAVAEPPSSLSLLSRAAVHALTRPVGVAGFLVPALRRLPTTRRQRRDRSVVRPPAMPVATRFNGPISPHRVWGSRQFTLVDLKTIRAAVPDAKVNDVALALVGGAMRRYLQAKGELPEGSLVAVMPISVRTTMAQRQDESEVEASAGGNRFAMANIAMATDVEDPLERVATIALATAAAKLDMAVSAQNLSQMSELLPGALMGSVQRAVTRAANRRGRAMGMHTTLTNVPGPQTPLYFCGARAVLITGMPPIVDGMGLINGVGSYNGTVPVCFTADRDMMPDPEFYEECLEASFVELLEAATERRGDATPKQKSTARGASGTKGSSRRTTRRSGTSGSGRDST
jgi:diacylglycerol O-acyltransferase / wax synthase